MIRSKPVWEQLAMNQHDTREVVTRQVFAPYNHRLIFVCVGFFELCWLSLVNRYDTTPTLHLSHIMSKPNMQIPTRSDLNQAVQAQEMARDWKFWI